MSLKRFIANSKVNWRHGIALTITYVVLARVSLLLATVSHHASPIWPASGLALGALVLLGRQYWPFIWIGAFCANVFLGSPLVVVAAIATGNTIEALIGRVFFRRFSNEKNRTIGISLIAALLASVFFAAPFAASIGALALPIGGVVSWADFRTIWVTWWTGDSIGILLGFPFLVNLWNRDYSTRSWKKFAEAAIYFGVLAAVAAFTLTSKPENTAVVTLLYPCLLVGIWRLGAIETGLSIFMLVLMSIVYTHQGRGPFYCGDFNTNLVYLQLFMASLGCTELVLIFLKRSANLKSSAVVLLLCWLLTGLVFHTFNRKEVEVDQVRFQNLVGDAQADLDERVLLYETAIRGGVGLFRSSERVTIEEWRSYISDLKLDAKFPSFYGMGYTIPADDRHLPKLLKEGKRGYGANFLYRELDFKGMKKTQGPRPEHFVVMAMEPRHPGLRPLGVDLGSEQDRHDALVHARDSGEITLSKHLELQNALSSNGFIVVAPIYRRGLPLESVEQRRKAFLGWVHSPLLVDLFFDGIFATGVKEIALEARFRDESEVSGSGELLYSSVLDPRELNRRHQIKSELRLWGHPIQLNWYRTANFQSRKDTTAAWLQFVCMIITLLLASLIGVFENLLEQAQRIADQKTRELAVRDRLWSSLTRVAPIGVFQLDVQGKLIFANEKWSEYTRVDRYRFPFFHWIEAIDPQDRPLVETQWQALRKRHLDAVQVQCRVAGSQKMFALSVRATEDETGAILHFIGMLQDISEIHARQMQVMQASRMASVGVMAAGMAHEINNPLTIIAGRAQLILRQLDAPHVEISSLKDSVAIVKQTVDRIARIVRGLRAFSRIGENDHFAPARVEEMVRSTLEFCSERFKKGGVELRLKALPEIELACREVQVCQVLLNLLNNAFDAASTLPERWVELEVVAAENDVRFIVTDSGPGISAEIAEKLMIPFFTTKPVGQGTGLGLSISKGIALDHRGDLILDTRSAHTRFVFTVSRQLLEERQTSSATA